MISRVGIGSYAFRYAIGFDNFKPKHPMTVYDFLTVLNKLNYNRVQLCENLNILKFNEKQLLKVKKLASDLNIVVELGMNTFNEENLKAYLKISKILSTKFLRIAVSRKTYNSIKNINLMFDNSLNLLKKYLKEFKENNIYIGLENHYDLPTEKLVELVQIVDDKQVGLIYDTTNHLAFLEKPESTLDLFFPYLFSIHLKDYVIEKSEASYLIKGTILGEGFLNMERILKKTIKSNKLISIILEMSIERNLNQNTNEVIQWEKGAVNQSTANLFSCLNKLKEENYLS